MDDEPDQVGRDLEIELFPDLGIMHSDCFGAHMHLAVQDVGGGQEESFKLAEGDFSAAHRRCGSLARSSKKRHREFNVTMKMAEIHKR